MPLEIYKGVISPALGRLDSETWHVRTKNALNFAESNPVALGIIERIGNIEGRLFDERLSVTLGEREGVISVTFDNPLIVGAGWTKDGKAIRALYRLGFAGVEVGSVLKRPQEGNPKKRQFMIGDGVCINWLGYNTPKGGMDEVETNVKKYKEDNIPTGVSVGKNEELEPGEDIPGVYARVVERFYYLASYFAYGFSHNSGLAMAVADRYLLRDIVQASHNSMDKKGKRKPDFIKVGPDLSRDQIDGVIQVAIDENVTGIIAVNSTSNPNIKAKYGEKWRSDRGGLTGNDPDYRKMATEAVRHIYSQTKGLIEIIGVGGVKDAQTALEKIKAGAKAVQVVTAIRGEGPRVASNINRGLADYLDGEGISSIQDLVGSDHVNLAA